MITVPSHVKNSKIGQDIRNRPGNSVIILRGKRFLRLAKVQRVLFSKMFIACFVITSLVLYTSRAPFLKAEATSFYPKACLGGFEAVRNAEGKPDTKVAAGSDAFDIENSAYLSGEQSSEMYCGNFEGVVADHTVPNKLTLTIYLTTKEKSAVSVIKNDTSASSTTFLEVLDATTTPVLENDGAQKEETKSEQGGGNFQKVDTVETKQEVVDSQQTETKKDTVPPVLDTPTVPAGGESGDAPQATLSLPLVLASYFVDSVFAEDEMPQVAPSEVPAPAQVETSAPTKETPPVGETPSTVPVAPVADETKSTVPTSDQTTLVASEAPSTESVPSLPEAETKQNIETSPASEPRKEEAFSEPLDNLPVVEKASVAQSIKDAIENFEVSDNVATSTEHPVFEVSYSLGGEMWIPLAYLGKENSRTISLQLPLEMMQSWADIGKLQVRVKNVESLDARDDLYIDGMSLAIGYEKDTETVEARNYIIKGIENTGKDMTVTVGGEKGKGSTIHVLSKQMAGLAFYNLDTEALMFTTEVSSDNPSNFDPNGTLPDFGSYALVLTRDTNWCSGKKIEECLKEDSFESLTYLDLFPSAETTESSNVKKLKETLKELLTYQVSLAIASTTDVLPSGETSANSRNEVTRTTVEEVVTSREILQAFKNPSDETLDQNKVSQGDVGESDTKSVPDNTPQTKVNESQEVKIEESVATPPVTQDVPAVTAQNPSNE